jgi:hypothetical protein
VRFLTSILRFLHFNRRNWKVVALCVFASTIFWFFNALNKTYSTNLRLPLKFEYDEESYVAVHALPTDVRVNVKGVGWNLFRRSIGLKLPALEIPLERPLETKKIVGSTLPAFFANQLEGLEINYILTDTLYVDLESKGGKWIKLRVDTTQLQLKKGYGLASFISVIPDSIFVEGPTGMINKLVEPVPLKLPFKNIDEHFMEDVEVELPSSIKRNPPTVAVMFNVQQFVTIRDSVRLVIENLPKNVWPMMGRRKIPVTYTVPENMIEDFRQDSVKAILDLAGIPRGDHVMKPALVGLPPFSAIIAIDSVSVKF